MKPFFAMEGIDTHVEPAAEPIEDEMPAIDLGIARVEEDVLALDSAYRGIENALESLETLNNIQQATQDTELTPAALKIIQITVENIKTQLGIFTEPSVSLEAVQGTSISMEGLTSIMKSIWDAIVRTMTWIWETITNIFSSSSRIRREKLMQSKLETLNKSFNVEARTLTSGKIYEEFAYFNKPLNIQTLREIAKELDLSSQSLYRLCESCITAETDLFKVLNRTMENMKSGRDTSGSVDELQEIGKEFIRSQISCFKKDTSIRTRDYQLALPESRYMQESLRYGFGLTRGRLIILSAAMLVEDDHELSPHLEIARPKNEHKAKNVEIEEMDESSLRSFLAELSENSQVIHRKLELLSRTSISEGKMSLRRLQTELDRNFSHVPLSVTSAMRTFIRFTKEIGRIRSEAFSISIEIYGSCLSFFDLRSYKSKNI